MVSWFGEERMGTDARAPGVYITLLMLQFRVRFTTDIPVLYREVGLRESRLSGILIMSLMNFKYVSKGQREISPNGMRVCEVPKQPIKAITALLSSAKEHPQKIH